MVLYVKKEFNLDEFEAWEGGFDRLVEIIELGIIDEAEAFIEINFGNEHGLTETEINDILWYEMDRFIEANRLEQEEEDLI